MILRPDRWTQHQPQRCGAHDLPEGYPCSCPRGWPRPAVYWNGETAIGARQVQALMQKYTQAKLAAAQSESR